jgi:hypothetical protein
VAGNDGAGTLPCAESKYELDRKEKGYAYLFIVMNKYASMKTA